MVEGVAVVVAERDCKFTADIFGYLRVEKGAWSRNAVFGRGWHVGWLEWGWGAHVFSYSTSQYALRDAT